MKTYYWVAVIAVVTACGGTNFSSGEDPPATVAGADGADQAGTPGVAGKAAGGSAGAAQAGHPSSGGGGSSGGGAPPVSCEFDVSQLTAALPSVITWNDFTYTNGAACFTCRDKPCGVVKVISWGTPTLEDGQYVYLPNTELPMIPVNIGVNDGSCTKMSECGAKLNSVGLAATVDEAERKVASAHSSVSFQDNACTRAASVPTGVMGIQLGSALAKSVQGLEIPCR